MYTYLSKNQSLKKNLLIILCLVPIIFFAAGCSRNDTPEKAEDLDFTVVSGTDVPGDLKELIQNRKKEPFELTYTDGSCLYVVKGYGKQQGGGFNIIVNDFYLSEDCLVFDAELFGPKPDEEVSGKASYPYIVIKTEYREEPVIFP